jgi:hypothetical protein
MNLTFEGLTALDVEAHMVVEPPILVTIDEPVSWGRMMR